MHGGKVWAESCQGEGTIFHFTLPIAEAPATTGESNTTQVILQVACCYLNRKGKEPLYSDIKLTG